MRDVGSGFQNTFLNIQTIRNQFNGDYEIIFHLPDPDASQSFLAKTCSDLEHDEKNIVKIQNLLEIYFQILETMRQPGVNSPSDKLETVFPSQVAKVNESQESKESKDNCICCTSRWRKQKICI